MTRMRQRKLTGAWEKKQRNDKFVFIKMTFLHQIFTGMGQKKLKNQKY